MHKKFGKKIHAEGISQNVCNSPSRHDFLLKFSVNTQVFYYLKKKLVEGNFYNPPPPIHNKVKLSNALVFPDPDGPTINILYEQFLFSFLAVTASKVNILYVAELI